MRFSCRFQSPLIAYRFDSEGGEKNDYQASQTVFAAAASLLFPDVEIRQDRVEDLLAGKAA
jgi:hypothetical protein